MQSSDDLPAALRALAGAFGGDDDAIGRDAVLFDRDAAHPAAGATMEDVRAYVAGNVARLLESSPGMLMSILYRIDVPEPKVQQVLSSAPHATLVQRLTDLIIERQLEKVRTRRKYRDNDDES